MNNKMRAYIALAISFVIFNVIAFAIPVSHNGSFWIAYAFTDIAFISQIAIWERTFAKSATLKSLFLKIPIIYIGSVYLIIQIIAFALCTALRTAVSLTLIMCIIVIGVSGVLMISADIGSTEIKRVESDANEKTKFMKSLGTEIELLAANEKNAELKAGLEELAEKVRYSELMSSAGTMEIDERLAALITELRCGNVNPNNIDAVSMLIEQRNIALKNNR